MASKALKGSVPLKRPSDVLSLIEKRGDRFVAVLLEDDSSYVGREVLSAPPVSALRPDSGTGATSASPLGACVLRSLILRGVVCIIEQTH